MNAYLINAEQNTVTPVEYNGDYKQIYQLCGFDCFTLVYLDEANVIFVDDNGLLNDPEHFFHVRGIGQPLAGNGLVLGQDQEGESTAPTLSLEAVRKLIRFSRQKVKGFSVSAGPTVTPLGPAFGIAVEAEFAPRDPAVSP